MKAIILSAGQGSRLLPLTADRPKCLISLSGSSLLEWQLRGLAAAGIGEAVVVTGFGAAQVEHALDRLSLPGLAVRTLFNPFYAVADNLASCWMARAEMTGEFLILNGDTLFEPEIARRLVAAELETRPITVTIDRKAAYDSDDMKVETDGDRLLAIGKSLDRAVVTGESIGFLRFNATGGALFVAEIERMMRSGEGVKRWYLSVIDRLAKQADIGTLSIQGLDWGEMDFPADVEANEALTRGWLAARAARAV